jgi:hypothetical protein
VEGALFAGDLRGREVKGRVQVSGQGRSRAVMGGYGRLRAVKGG